MTREEAAEFLLSTKAVRGLLDQMLSRAKELALDAEGNSRWYLRGYADAIREIQHRFERAEALCRLPEESGEIDVYPTLAVGVSVRRGVEQG